MEILRRWWWVSLPVLAVALMMPVLHHALTRFDVVVGLNNQSGLDVRDIRLAEAGRPESPNLLNAPVPSG